LVSDVKEAVVLQFFIEKADQAFTQGLKAAPFEDEPFTSFSPGLAAIVEAEKDMKADRVRPLVDIARETGL
jgi:hypothetical protein